MPLSYVLFQAAGCAEPSKKSNREGLFGPLTRESVECDTPRREAVARCARAVARSPFVRFRTSWLQALVVFGLLLGAPGDSQSEHHKVGMLEATVCTDAPGVQHVRAVVERRGENEWANCIELQFLDGSANKVSSYVVPHDVPNGRGRIVNIGTAAFAASSGTNLDVTLPAGTVMPTNGQVCYHGIANSRQFKCKDIDVCVDVTPVTCGSAAVCGNGVVEDGEECDDGGTEAGDCCSSTCQIESASTVCRPSVGSCDVAEFCDGGSATCPADAFDPGLCDDGAFCTVGSTCVAGSCTPSVARDCSLAGDQCNIGVCDEASDSCQPQPVNDGAVCTDGNASTVSDVCTAGSCAGVDLCAGVICAPEDACN